MYHDLTHQIVVVHNQQDNSFSLYNDNERRPNRGRSPSIPDPEQNEIFCPNCGIDLLEFLAQGNRPKYRRRHSNNSGSTMSGSWRNDRSTVALADKAINKWPIQFSPYPSMGLSPEEFMHRDYFKLLANVTENSAALGAPGDEPSISLPSDLFNQGYFDRFFKKIPPGVLGSGARAQVYKVVHVLKDIQLGVFAVKRINVGDHSQFLDHVLNEVLILYELSVRGANEHNLIRYNHVWMETGDLSDLNTILLGREGAPLEAGINVVPYVYILQQYCDGGHLEHMMMSNFQREMMMLTKEKLEIERARRRSRKSGNPLLPLENSLEKRWLLDIEIWKFFHDIANGVVYLHSHGILHRDLKPSNCLLESRYDPVVIPPAQEFDSLGELDDTLLKLPRILVSDFGEGKFIDKQGPETSIFSDERRGNTGTVEFTDPKLWIYARYEKTKEGKRKFAHNFTYECDIYSLGMILCYLCVGVLPFTELLTDTNDPEAIRNDISQWHKNLTVHVFHEWFDKQLLCLNNHSSEAMDDFKVLIYLMIKGDESSPKPSAYYVLNFLESMKSSRFLISMEVKQEHDEMKTNQMKSDPTGYNEVQPEADDTLDLFTLQDSENNTKIIEPDKHGIRRSIHIGVCLACLAVLEMIENIDLRNIVRTFKVGNLLILLHGLQNENRRLPLLLIAVFLTGVAVFFSLKY